MHLTVHQRICGQDAVDQVVTAMLDSHMHTRRETLIKSHFKLLLLKVVFQAAESWGVLSLSQNCIESHESALFHMAVCVFHRFVFE